MIAEDEIRRVIGYVDSTVIGRRDSSGLCIVSLYIFKRVARNNIWPYCLLIDFQGFREPHKITSTKFTGRL